MPPGHLHSGKCISLFRLRHLCASALLFFCAIVAHAQTTAYKDIDPEYELDPVPLNSKKNLGLLNDVITDKEGFFWFSGNKGISAFDGHNLLHYSNQNALYPLRTDSSKEDFGYICKDPTGLLYIQSRTKYSVLCFDPVTRRLLDEIKPDHISNRISQLSISDSGEILLLGINSTDNSFSVRKVRHLRAGQAIYHGKVKAWTSILLGFGAGNHWLVQGKLVVRIADGGALTKSYTFPGSEPNPSISRVCLTKDQIFFLSAQTGKIYTWDKKTDRMTVYLDLPAPLKNKTAYKFAVHKDIVYMATNIRLFLINARDKSIQDMSASYIDMLRKGGRYIQNEELNKIFFDDNQNAYLMRQHSIYRLKRKMPSLDHFTEKVKIKDTVLNTSFRSLAEDEHKRIYVAYYNGVASKAPDEAFFKQLPVATYLSPKVFSTYNMHYHKQHLYWNAIDIDLQSGSYSSPLTHPNSTHTTQYLQGDTLWLYPWWGIRLYRYTLSSRKLDTVIIDKRLTLSDENVGMISDITADEGGNNLWLATQNDGIALINKQGKLVKHYTPGRLGLSDEELNTINTLLLTRDGLWFGCGDGLGLLNTATGKTILYNNPFNINGSVQNRTFFSIQPDTAGNFYLGSSAGIVYFDTHRRQFFNLSENHPLSKLEFNRASSFRSSAGRFYFGSIDGLYSFMPSALSFPHASVPIKKLKLCNVIIYNSEQKRYRQLSAIPEHIPNLDLGPFDNNIEFQFAAPEFNHIVSYSYRIAGQNNQWSEYSTEGKVFVYNLQPGVYTLEVKASTDQSDNNARLYRLKLTMAEVWYKKTWVLVFFFLGATATIFLAIYYRLNQKLKRQNALTALRSKISMDLHDDVGSVLSGLAMQSELLTYTAPAEHQSAFKEISIMSREAMEQMRDIVWSMDHRKDKYENLVDRMRAYAERHLNVNNIRYDFITEGIPTGKFINPEKRQTIYLIFKEALANVMKHSDAKHVLIRFTEDKGSLQLLVQDNGSKKPEAITDGMGLSNIKERAKRIGGTLTAVYDQGFRVTLQID